MPDQGWATEKDREHFYNAYETRKLWSGSFDHLAPYRLLTEIEFYLKNQMIEGYQAQEIIDAFNDKYPSMGYRAKIVYASRGYWIPIPYGRGIEKVMMEKPQSIALVGDVGSGKTVTSWTFVWKIWNALGQRGEVHVYGDVDNITGGLMKMNEAGKANFELGKFISSITAHDDYRTPGIPEDNTPQIILYNELGEQLLSKKATSNENIEINLQAFRRRHTKRWIIYNVIREASLEAVLRETSQIKVFRPMYGELLDKLRKNAPKSWLPAINEVPKLSYREGICIYPVLREGGGDVNEIYETEAPSWYWQAKDLAEMNKRIAYGDESVPMNVMREAINIYKTEDMSFRAIASFVRNKYGYDKSDRWWSRTIQEFDPDYTAHKPGKKKKGEKGDGTGAEAQDGSIPQGEQPE